MFFLVRTVLNFFLNVIMIFGFITEQRLRVVFELRG